VILLAIVDDAMWNPNDDAKTLCICSFFLCVKFPRWFAVMYVKKKVGFAIPFGYGYLVSEMKFHL